MDLKEFRDTPLEGFVKEAVRTESVKEKLSLSYVDHNNLLYSIKILIAASKIIDQYKKNLYYGKMINRDELGIYKEYIKNVAKAMIDNAVQINPIQLLRGNFSEDINNLESDSIPIDFNTRLLHSILGLCTESGEIAEAFHDSLLQNKEFDTVNFYEELGDLEWYKAIGLDELGMSFGGVNETVIKKLRKRFPEKFTEDNAINRDLNSEREVLEKGFSDG